jgi:hypothetical protein
VNLGRRHIDNLSRQRQSPLPQLIEFVPARFGRTMFRLGRSPAEPEGYPSGSTAPKDLETFFPCVRSGQRLSLHAGAFLDCFTL